MIPVVVKRSAWPTPWEPKLDWPVADSHRMYASRDRRQHDGLERDALHRADGRLLLGESVGAEGEGQEERDPRRPAVVDGQHHDRDERDAHRHPLQPSQPLAEDQHAHQHRDQRVDEVAQRRLDDAVVVDAPDVAAPVDGDDDGGTGDEQQLAAVAQERLELGHPVPQDEDRHHRHQRPHHAVGEDLDGAARLEQRPVERERAPQDVRRRAEDETTAAIWHSASVGVSPSPTMGRSGSGPGDRSADHRFSRGNHHAHVPRRPGCTRGRTARRRGVQRQRLCRLRTEAHHRGGLAARQPGVLQRVQAQGQGHRAPARRHGASLRQRRR